MVKRYLSYLTRIILLAIIFTLLFWKLSPKKYQSDFLSHAPLPDFLNLSRNKQVGTLDLWFPFAEKIHADESHIPSYTAQSILSYDLTTDRIIYEKNAHQKLPMASLTKIMTAIIALENITSTDIYTVQKEALVGEDSMGLTAGEKLTHTDLLYGLMLQSGNDAAEVFAHTYPQGREAFVKAMNDKAEALGLTDTHFTNPTGLEGDGDQHTTPYDLLVMTRYALDHFPEFAAAGSTYEHDIAATSTHKAYTLYNETNLLTTYPGVIGLKTGYTPEAGLCLVTLLEYKGHRIEGIILNSHNRRGDMKELLDTSLQQIGITPPEHD